MSQNVLVLNCGSSSLKFAIIDATSGAEYLSGLAERLSEQSPQVKINQQGHKNVIKLNAGAQHQKAIEVIVAEIKHRELVSDLIAVGHRVVHGGETFTGSVIIDQDVIKAIEQNQKLAPLHNPANLLGIKIASDAFSDLPQIAVFDTAFHQSMPEHAYLYPLPHTLYQDSGIRRYGFHGTSHYFVSREAAALLNLDIDKANFITAHLGNGCSVTAIKNGQSVDTSMGLTPLEGLVMGTRCGDLDPGIIHYLTSQLDYSSEQVNQLLNKESGLLGISQLSNDCRTIEQAVEIGDKQAELALDIFCYRLAKYIASYLVPLGKLDALIFTGGIGENSSLIREKVVKHLAFLDLTIDESANLAARFGQNGVIASNQNGCRVLVVPTNEEWVIAQDAATLTESI